MSRNSNAPPSDVISPRKRPLVLCGVLLPLPAMESEAKAGQTDNRAKPRVPHTRGDEPSITHLGGV